MLGDKVCLGAGALSKMSEGGGGRTEHRKEPSPGGYYEVKVHSPSHGQVTEGRILKAVLLLQLFG